MASLWKEFIMTYFPYTLRVNFPTWKNTASYHRIRLQRRFYRRFKFKRFIVTTCGYNNSVSAEKAPYATINNFTNEIILIGSYLEH